MWHQILLFTLIGAKISSTIIPIGENPKTTIKLADIINQPIDNRLKIMINNPNFTQNLLIKEVLYRTTFDQVRNLVVQPQYWIIPVNDVQQLTHLQGATSANLYFVFVANLHLVDDVAHVLWEARLLHSFIIFINNNGIITTYKLKISNCGVAVSAQPAKTPTDLWDLKQEFQGCPLYVIWAIMPPFVLFGESNHKGIYIDFLEAFGQASSRNLVYRPNNSEYLYDISHSYDYTGIIEDLQRGHADIFAGPADLHLAPIIHVTPIVVENNLLFLSPIPFESFWTTLFKILRMLAGSISTTLLVVVVLRQIARFTVDRDLFPSVVSGYIMLIAGTVGLPCLNRHPKSTAVKIYLVTFLTQSMIFSILVQGTFVSFLSGSIYGKSINTIEELLSSDLHLIVINGLNFLFGIGGKEGDWVIYQRIEAREDVENIYELGNFAVESRNFSTIIDTGFLTIRPNILKSFSSFPVFTVPQGFAMAKDAYFVEQFSKWISQLLEIGIMVKFATLYKHFYALRNYVDEDKRDYVVTFDNIKPAIGVGLTGHFISFLNFLGEMIWYWMRRNNN